AREIRIVAPSAMMPEAAEFAGARRLDSLDDGIAGADVVMMLRIQHERAGGAESDRDASRPHESRSRDRLRCCRRTAVGHPPPGREWRRSAHGRARAPCRGAPGTLRMSATPAHRGTIFLED